jgi:hypothetical protein
MKLTDVFMAQVDAEGEEWNIRYVAASIRLLVEGDGCWR